MKILIEHDDLQWFKEELRIQHDNSPIQPGYSLGIVSSKPDGEIVSVEEEDILFFCEC